MLTSLSDLARPSEMHEPSIGFDYDQVFADLDGEENSSDDLRELNRRWSFIAGGLLTWILASRNRDAAALQAAVALGLNSVLEGRSMEYLEEMAGCTRANLSAGAVRFCEAYGLEPSEYMRSIKARGAYRDRRVNQLQRC